MKAVLLALAAGLLLFSVGTMCLRHVNTENRARMLSLLFLAIFPLLICLHTFMSDDLGFLPREAVISTPALDLAFSSFLYIAGFCGGILQLYNLADRGLSLRMLIDILQAPTRAMTSDELATNYGGGQGIAWMYEKRIHDMKSAGLLFERNNMLSLTRRGRKLARVYAPLQRFAHIERERINK